MLFAVGSLALPLPILKISLAHVPYPLILCSEQTEQDGLYGLGINVNLKFPHTVRSASGLQDPTGRPIPDSVAVHDTLTHVDDVSLEGYMPSPLTPTTHHHPSQQTTIFHSS